MIRLYYFKIKYILKTFGCVDKVVIPVTAIFCSEFPLYTVVHVGKIK